MCHECAVKLTFTARDLYEFPDVVSDFGCGSEMNAILHIHDQTDERLVIVEVDKNCCNIESTFPIQNGLLFAMWAFDVWRH